MEERTTDDEVPAEALHTGDKHHAQPRLSHCRTPFRFIIPETYCTRRKASATAFFRELVSIQHGSQ